MMRATKSHHSRRMNWYPGKRIILGILTFAGMLTLFLATSVSADRLRTVDDDDTVILRNNVHPLARPEFETGATAPSLLMERMILSLQLAPEKSAALERYLAELHDPASPNYQHWLTPEEFRKRFAPGPEDIKAVTGWLTSHGFTVEEVARGGTWINFSGPVSFVERAFHVKIRNYNVNGQLRHANANDPAIPRGLSDLVGGIVSLHNFPRKTMNNGLLPLKPESPAPDATFGNSHYLAPGDFATLYNVNALYSTGIDGSGQSIAIVGRTHPSSTNWSTFRSLMALPANPPVVIVNGTDPGDLGGDEDNEADLDVEWSGAVAINATIIFVVSESTGSTDGVDISAQYIVNNNLAPVMSTSFGECESQLGHTERTFYNNLWQQAATQGITSFVSSGDSGAAGCNAGSDSSGSGAAVNGLASTSYNVAVGGTEFNEGSGSYWNTGNGTGDTSVISYIPEIAWNESGSVSGGSGLWSTGGGVSSYYSKPAWQVSSGVPADGKRDLPDVSLSAAGHDGYLVETQGALYAIGGTSASSPSFAGLMALIVQKTGQRQGNANTRFYQLAAAQYGAGGATVFHDITSGNNSVPGVTGYSSTTGYDLATGLGSVDANALVNNWVPDFTILPSPVSLSVAQGSSGASTITTVVSGNFNNAIALSVSGLPAGATVSFSPATIAAPGSGSSTLTFTAGASATVGTFPVTITAVGGGATHTATVNLTIIQAFTMTASVVNGAGGTITSSDTTVPYGGSVTFTITPDPGYTLTGLTDNGVNVSALEGPAGTFTYSISNVTAIHTVIATFAVAAATAVPALPPFSLSAAILIAAVLGYGSLPAMGKNDKLKRMSESPLFAKEKHGWRL